jgi:hypothetical protein
MTKAESLLLGAHFGPDRVRPDRRPGWLNAGYSLAGGRNAAVEATEAIERGVPGRNGRAGSRPVSAGQPAEAIALGEEAVRRMRTMLVTGHPMLPVALTNLAAFCAESGRPAQAMPSYLEGLDIKRRDSIRCASSARCASPTGARQTPGRGPLNVHLYGCSVDRLPVSSAQHFCTPRLATIAYSTPPPLPVAG